jgi:hypothetical protein
MLKSICCKNLGAPYLVVGNLTEEKSCARLNFPPSYQYRKCTDNVSMVLLRSASLALTHPRTESGKNAREELNTRFMPDILLHCGFATCYHARILLVFFFDLNIEAPCSPETSIWMQYTSYIFCEQLIYVLRIVTCFVAVLLGVS